jgi:hypothetical protein
MARAELERRVTLHATAYAIVCRRVFRREIGCD